jgi:hypothetical protein
MGFNVEEGEACFEEGGVADALRCQYDVQEGIAASLLVWGAGMRSGGADQEKRSTMRNILMKNKNLREGDPRNHRHIISYSLPYAPGELQMEPET